MCENIEYIEAQIALCRKRYFILRKEYNKERISYTPDSKNAFIFEKLEAMLTRAEEDLEYWNAAKEGLFNNNNNPVKDQAFLF